MHLSGRNNLTGWLLPGFPSEHFAPFFFIPIID